MGRDENYVNITDINSMGFLAPSVSIYTFITISCLSLMVECDLRCLVSQVKNEPLLVSWCLSDPGREPSRNPLVRGADIRRRRRERSCLAWVAEA